MAGKLSFDRLRSILVAAVTQLPDYRKRPNTVYELSDAALGAFAVFFMQSASFLAYQRDMQRTQGHDHAQSLFGIDQVPSDPHIRNLLDPIAPEYFAGPFWRIFEHLRDGDYLPAYHFISAAGSWRWMAPATAEGSRGERIPVWSEAACPSAALDVGVPK